MIWFFRVETQNVQWEFFRSPDVGHSSVDIRRYMAVWVTCMMCVYTLCLVGNCNTLLSCVSDVGFGLAALPVLMLVGNVMMGDWV